MPAANMPHCTSHFHISRSARAAIIACILLAMSLPLQCEELSAAACAAAGTDTKQPESSSFTFRVTPSIFDVDLRPCHACVHIALPPLAISLAAPSSDLSRICDNMLFSDTQTGIQGKCRLSDHAANSPSSPSPSSPSPSSPSPASSFCTAIPARSTTRCISLPLLQSRVTRTAAMSFGLPPALPVARDLTHALLSRCCSCYRTSQLSCRPAPQSWT